jgi:hypothetical protein
MEKTQKERAADKGGPKVEPREAEALQVVTSISPSRDAYSFVAQCDKRATMYFNTGLHQLSALRRCAFLLRLFLKPAGAEQVLAR